MNQINAYGTGKTIVISIRVSEEFNERAIQHARHVLGYSDLSSFVRDAVEEKVSGHDHHLFSQLERAVRNLNRVAGVFIRIGTSGDVLSENRQRKLHNLLKRTIEDGRNVIREATEARK